MLRVAKGSLPGYQYGYYIFLDLEGFSYSLIR